MVGTHRLVTLVGTGGVGKTRLARAVHARTHRHTGDGSWWADLAPTSDLAGVLNEITRALGVEVFPGTPASDALRGRLASARGMLVLDNCEHVLLPVAAAVELVLGAAGDVRLLVTSRERLGLPDEHVLPLPPLRLPPVDGTDTRSPAVALFLDRARAVAPDVRLGPEVTPRVVELVRRLDGLPLALELAAGRVGTLTLDDLVTHVTGRLDLLRSTSRHLPLRHRALAETIAWSFDLLDDEEQRAFLRLAVFAAPFDLGAAAAVLEVDRPEAADLVGRLVDRSLLVRPEGVGRGRYRMLETLRSFATESSAEHADEHRARHARWAAELSARVADGVIGPEEATWDGVVTGALTDLGTAARWASRPGAAPAERALAERVAAGLVRWAYFRLRADVLEWSGPMLAGQREHEQGPAGASVRSRVVAAASSAAWTGGRVGAAMGLAERALELAGGPETADAAVAVDSFGDAAVAAGETGRAEAVYQAGFRSASRDDRAYDATLALCGLLLSRTYADPGAAVDEELLASLASWAERSANPSATSLARYTAGEVVSDHDPPRALRLFAEAAELARSVGSLLVVGVSLTAATALRSRHGEIVGAAADFRRALELWLRAGNHNLLVTCLRNLVPLLIGAGRFAAGVEVAAALDRESAERAPYGAEAERLAACLREARRALGERGFADAWARGAQRAAVECAEDAIGSLDRLLAH